MVIMIGASVPHLGNGFNFSNPGGGCEYPVSWTATLVALAMLGDWAFALGHPFTKGAIWLTSVVDQKDHFRGNTRDAHLDVACQLSPTLRCGLQSQRLGL